MQNTCNVQSFSDGIHINPKIFQSKLYNTTSLIFKHSEAFHETCVPITFSYTSYHLLCNNEQQGVQTEVLH